jgi:hypothetical protein
MASAGGLKAPDLYHPLPGRDCIDNAAPAPQAHVPRRQMAAVRQELDQEYEARNGLASKPAADANPAELSSTSRI